MEVLIIFGLILLFTCVKKVPPHTAIIIDRDAHYLKTKRYGYYFFLPWRDKITTIISTNGVVHSSYEFYETEDGVKLSIGVNCMYRTEDIAHTLDLLKNVRRSIDDIIKSSVYFATGSLKFEYIPSLLKSKIRESLSKELDSVDVILMKSDISYSNAQYAASPCFKPHVSRGNGSIDSIKTKKSNDDDSPIHMNY